MDSSSDAVNRLLTDVRQGDPTATAKLLSLLYEELRRLAARVIRGERADDLLDPTALVHEAYIRLVKNPSSSWDSRKHFFDVAARSMRQVLVDHARERSAGKRGGQWQRVELSESMRFSTGETEGLLAVAEALDRLATFNARLSRVVELRIFAGLSTHETAELLGVGETTVRHDWSLAKAWLRQQLEERPTLPAAGEHTGIGPALSPELSITFDADVSPAQLKATLKALADYFRSCGGAGLQLEQNSLQRSS